MSYGYDARGRIAKHMTMRAKALGTGYEQNSMTYDELALEQYVREILNEEYTSEMETALNSEVDREGMLSIITKVAKDCKKAHFSSAREFAAACDKVYNNIFSFGELQPMLDSEDVEEINCNGWQQVEIVTRKGVIKRNDVFHSPQECLDMTKRLARLGGFIADVANPIGDSDIGPGVRISVMIPPVVMEEVGAVFSIRKQREHTITKEELITNGTATKEVLDFMQLVVDHRVSAAFAGSTGSGKTTDLNFCLFNMPLEHRVFVIEEGSRELKLDKFDENGYPIARVLYAKTRFSKTDNMMNVDQNALDKTALRFDPRTIAQSEMRGAEGYQVLIASQTGHQVLTTFHASDTRIAYKRYLNMCIQGNQTIPVDMLQAMCYQSIPIMVYKELMADGCRRYVEITEAYEYPEETYKLIPIFRYVISENIYDENGKLVEIKGEFEQINYISNKLAYMLFHDGAEIEEVRKYAKPNYSPAVDAEINGPIEEQRIPPEERQRRRELRQWEAENPEQKQIGVEVLRNLGASRTTDSSLKARAAQLFEDKMGGNDTIQREIADEKINNAIDKVMAKKEKPAKTAPSKKEAPDKKPAKKKAAPRSTNKVDISDE